MNYTDLQFNHFHARPVDLRDAQGRRTYKHLVIVVTPGNLLFIKESMEALTSELNLFPVLEHVEIMVKQGTYSSTVDDDLNYFLDYLDYWADHSAGAQKLLWMQDGGDGTTGDVPLYARVKIDPKWCMVNPYRHKRYKDQGKTTDLSVSGVCGAVKYWPVEL